MSHKGAVFLIYIYFIFKLTINFKITLCGYVDNHQAYISFLPTPDDLSNALQDLKWCVKIIRQFLLTHNLLLNDSKTEIILIGNKKNTWESGWYFLKNGETFQFPNQKQLRILELYLISELQKTCHRHVLFISIISYFSYMKISYRRYYYTTDKLLYYIAPRLLQHFFTITLKI